MVLPYLLGSIPSVLHSPVHTQGENNMCKENKNKVDMDLVMESLDDAKKAIDWFLEDADLDPSDDAKLNSITNLSHSIYYARLVFWERAENTN